MPSQQDVGLEIQGTEYNCAPITSMFCQKARCCIYQYSVGITTENGDNVDGKGIDRRIMNQLCKTYASDHLDGKRLAYDGEKSLYTVGPLPQNDF